MNKFFDFVENFVKFWENPTNTSLFQAVLVAVGAAVVFLSRSLFDKSKFNGIVAGFLGLLMVIVPAMLPPSKSEGSLATPTDFAGRWQIYEGDGWGFEWTGKMNDRGEISGFMTIRSCPIDAKPCPQGKFSIDGRYYKESNELRFSRRVREQDVAALGAPAQKYSVIFHDPEFGRGSFTVGDDTVPTFFIIFQTQK